MCVTLSPGSTTMHRWVFGEEGVSERPTHLRSLVLPPGVNSGLPKSTVFVTFYASPHQP